MRPPRRYENFDAIRLLAAASVIFYHAFLIAEGHERNEPFMRFTGHILGIQGVFVFLMISGFLVTHSFFRSQSLRNFAWKRLLRVYPALAVCAVVCALLVAPFYSELGPVEYLKSLYGPKYIAKVLLLFDVYEIKTVRFSRVIWGRS